MGATARSDVAMQRYLRRHLEPGLPAHHFSAPLWHDVLILPAYRESAAVLQRLSALPRGQGRALVVLVLNRPDKDADSSANATLRAAIETHASTSIAQTDTRVHHLTAHTDLYLLDMERRFGPTPSACGVGLARKAGCDLALQWMHGGGISGRWLYCTDADATLPADYFRQLHGAGAAAAAVFPFRHMPGDDAACNFATALYELRLHHYVLGLEYAGSPYAYHTLGSALAVDASAYAQVHGFPRRSGAEDFYILNKLAKTGPVVRLHGGCIALASRLSARVPFGTGPAVRTILAETAPANAALFYHPACFAALRAVLANLPDAFHAPSPPAALACLTQDLPAPLAQQSQAVLLALKALTALQHCRQHGKTAAQFQSQFHQWFDGFRTLKFLHLLRDAGWPQQSLRQLDTLSPVLWPEASRTPCDVEELQAACALRWGWRPTAT